MKKIIVVVILLLWNCLANAQVINGVVCDKTTKKPISDVSVYLDGTSINTITNASGRFELRSQSLFNTKLVLHHLLYQTAIIDNPFRGLSDTLFIVERPYELPELIVYADIFKREQKMKAFREHFLGTTSAGKSCVIQNEDDIQLSVNMQTRTLTATSENPIEVVNKYLGYKVSFFLIDFSIQYLQGISKFNLDRDNMRSSFFAVASSFEDLAPDNRRIKQRRDDNYESSSNFFFKSFANDSIQENKFRIFSNRSPVDHRQYFAKKDTLGQKMISIVPETDINKIVFINFGSELKGVISVLNRRKNQTDIFFMTDTFMVDRYGNIDEIDKISFSGQMSELRAGNMLPIDYEAVVK